MDRKIVVALIRLYQRTLSPDHGLMKYFFPRGTCRFSPTCSEYALQAVTERGVIHGLWLGAKRVGRCHPWHAGGYDPVPKA